MENNDDKNEKKPVEVGGREKLYEDFLVSTNTAYRDEILSWRDKWNELKIERDELENDNGKMEIATLYMRGILKNYFYIDRYNGDIKCQMKQMMHDTNSLTFFFHMSFVTAMVGLFLGVITNIMTIEFNYLYLMIIIISVSVVYVLVYDAYIVGPTKRLKLKVLSIEAEIDTIKKTNALLPDLFDHI